MGGLIRAVAMDLDGTLAHNNQMSETTRAAIAAARSRGLLMILVTGRTGELLDAQFPNLRASFDGVVLENGAVLDVDGEERHLASPVDPELVAVLRARGVDCTVGAVLVDVATDDVVIVNDVIGELGLDAQVIRNRGRSMVLPAGVSKGTGLRRVLRELGLSPHNVLAVGDAENDLALLDAAEIGVAVANAVPSVKHHADLVLADENGAGVQGLLAGPVVGGSERVIADRHRVRIGRYLDDGSPVRVPGLGVNVLIRGSSGSGKSHLAGLLIERWLRRDYTVLVLDVEGDYQGLAHLPGVVTVNGAAAAAGAEPTGLLRHRSTAIIVDLAGLDDDAVASVIRGLGPALDAERAAWGMPHWVVLDEAHTSLGIGGAMEGLLRPNDRGFLLVTFRPEDLRPDVASQIDVTITAVGRSETRKDRIALLSQPDGSTRAFSMAPRQTPHVRHWHKYTTLPLPAHHWFRFTDDKGHEVAQATNVADFCRHIKDLDSTIIWGHLERGDFSRWLVKALQEYRLAALASAIERDVLARQALELRRARERLVLAIEEFYGLDDESLESAGPGELSADY